MLDTETKSRINAARDVLVGKVPDPKSQVEQITIALIYKFMDDMDRLGQPTTCYLSFRWLRIVRRHDKFEVVGFNFSKLRNLSTPILELGRTGVCVDVNVPDLRSCSTEPISVQIDHSH